MTPKDEALRILMDSIPAATPTEEVGAGEMLGRVLAEDVTSDLDMPPFHRSAMDGFAVRAEDVANAPIELAVTETIHAGQVAELALGAGQAARIMTGAPLPEGADAVVMIEWTSETSDGRVRLERSVGRGQNVAWRGEDMREGEIVLGCGRTIRPVEVGMLAQVGRDRVSVHRRPTVAVAATGDELLPPGAGKPGPGQIRESNGQMLVAQVASLGLGIDARWLGIAKDTVEDTRAMIERGLAHDVMMLSGGVSMGDHDHVHKELKARGMEVFIEKIAIKPGKPLIFGRLPKSGGGETYVFGLPGNPVSSFVTFELFVRPFLSGLMGLAPPHRLEVKARIVGPIRGKAIPRFQHIPARIEIEDENLVARAVEWHGSGDLRGIVDANGFILVPPHEAPPTEGVMTPVMLLEPRVLRDAAPLSRPVVS